MCLIGTNKCANAGLIFYAAFIGLKECVQFVLTVFERTANKVVTNVILCRNLELTLGYGIGDIVKIE